MGSLQDYYSVTPLDPLLDWLQASQPRRPAPRIWSIPPAVVLKRQRVRALLKRLLARRRA